MLGGLKRRYDERVLPVAIDRLCGASAFAPLRAATVAGTHGTVLEIGFGSGLNLAHYPAEVDRVLAVEPSGRAVGLAARRIAAAPFAVDIIGLDGQQLPLDDASVDGAVSTFTLCTIPDVDAALAEVRRVLRPGGAFHVLEHGLADDARTRRWQHRLDPLQQCLAGGCHLVRHVPSLLERAGFEWIEMQRWSIGRPRVLSWMTRGVAVSAGR